MPTESSDRELVLRSLSETERGFLWQNKSDHQTLLNKLTSEVLTYLSLRHLFSNLFIRCIWREYWMAPRDWHSSMLSHSISDTYRLSPLSLFYWDKYGVGHIPRESIIAIWVKVSVFVFPCQKHGNGWSRNAEECKVVFADDVKYIENLLWHYHVWWTLWKWISNKWRLL